MTATNPTDKTAIRNAATVIVLRDRFTAPRILMGQRGAGAAFMPNKFVFPGGAVDAGDAAGGADLFERGDAAEMEPVAGDGTGPGDRRLLLHDQGALGPGLAAFQFAGLDPLGHAADLLEGHVEGFLGAFGSGPGVGQDAGVMRQAVEDCGDGIAQAPPFADLGEQLGL